MKEMEPPAIVRPVIDIEARILRVASRWSEMKRMNRSMLERARDNGEDLAAIKADSPHGTWLPRLERMGIPERTAQRHMQVFKLWDQIRHLDGFDELGIFEVLRILRERDDKAEERTDDETEDIPLVETKTEKVTENPEEVRNRDDEDKIENTPPQSVEVNSGAAHEPEYDEDEDDEEDDEEYDEQEDVSIEEESTPTYQPELRCKEWTPGKIPYNEDKDPSNKSVPDTSIPSTPGIKEYPHSDCFYRRLSEFNAWVLIVNHDRGGLEQMLQEEDQWDWHLTCSNLWPKLLAASSVLSKWCRIMKEYLNEHPKS